jgi:hypothetical protein
VIVAIDEGRDYHAEMQAFFARFDAERKAAGKPRILHNHTRYIQGWVMDTETGAKWFELAPHRGTPAYNALVKMHWNKDARGVSHD